MQIKHYSREVCLIATSLALVLNTAQADHIASQFTAKELIGMKVVNAQDEKLGTVQDIVISLDSGRAPCAIINPTGFGDNIAVSLDALKSSEDGKAVMLAASKEDLKAASKTPTGNWAAMENARWTKSVNGYYGNPRLANDRYDRDTADDGKGIRTYARGPTAKGAEKLMQPADKALCDRVCDNLDTVQVNVEGGTVHLYGTVDSDATRRSIETKARSTAGVDKVENHIKVRNP